MKKLFTHIKNPIVFRAVLSGFFTIVFVSLFFFYFTKVDRIAIQNAFVTSSITTLAPTVPGKLKDVFVHEGEHVNKGDKLALVGNELLYAYTDGLITETNKQIGSLVSPQMPIAKLMDENTVRIDASIDENKGLNRIKPGQIASFTIDALPGKIFWGVVDEVGSTARQTQAAFSISSERPTQQFDVYIKFNTSDYPEIKNGMSSKVVIFTKS
jgi:multidrug resistance efflux pump